MQTVLGANGQIAGELTRELYRNHTRDIRLVQPQPEEGSRHRRAPRGRSIPRRQPVRPLEVRRTVPDSEVTTYREGITQVLGANQPRLSRARCLISAIT